MSADTVTETIVSERPLEAIGVATAAPEPAERDAAGHGVLVVIPAYNEERFIGSVVLRARQYADHVLVVDDGSSDATAEIAEAAGANVLRQPRNAGKAAALALGFEKAREFYPEVLVMLDGDGQHLPEEIEQVVAPVMRGSADIVVGSRYLRDARGVPKHRAWGHRVFNLITSSSSGVYTSDSQSGFRAFSTRALATLSFQSRGFCVESEMQFLAREHDLRLQEVPITISYHEPPKRSVLAQGLAVLYGIIQLTIDYRPLLVLGVPGALLLTLGLVFGGMVIDAYLSHQQFALGYALVSLLLSILGPMTLFTGLILHSTRRLLKRMMRPEAPGAAGRPG